MLRAISRVASPCWSIAAEIDVVISLICAMVSVMPPIEVTRFTGGSLHRGDLRRDFLGRLRRLVGERLHLGSDHREAAAGFTGARRLDGGVQRQQVGLRGDRGGSA